MISIFTPTFNRLETLKRLHSSLLKQTCLDFEWIVVDDGSTDESESYLMSVMSVSPFNLIYKKQVNAGKHVAINTGSKLSSRDWFFIVDSDDFLSKDAIGSIIDKINTLGDKYVGICVRKGDLDGNVIGRKIEDCPQEIDLTPTDAGKFFRGDLAYIFKTKTILRNQFPSFDGEKFVPELLIWNKIALDGKIKYFAREIYYFCEYLPDGYSKNFKLNLRSNPNGFGLFYREQIFVEKSMVLKLKYIIRLIQCFWFKVTNAK